MSWVFILTTPVIDSSCVLEEHWVVIVHSDCNRTSQSGQEELRGGVGQDRIVGFWLETSREIRLIAEELIFSKEGVTVLLSESHCPRRTQMN